MNDSAPVASNPTLIKLNDTNERLYHLLEQLEGTLSPVLTSLSTAASPECEVDVYHEFDAVVNITTQRADRLASILDRIRL